MPRSGNACAHLPTGNKRELLYGPTNEEMITEIFRSFVKILQKPAPLNLYHIPVEIPRREQPPAVRRHARAASF